ncbi:unnamed protein product (macronuclear) [Paramecium tetraurelia]|uniref:Uncharacterized protein n=1 Tax=Paramecium tetraurelia TaxID=5888 RepID=A0BE44_PARTE|nr:uncharacterized protein GSPATT00027843001 [Paramecium tetraurelia]CAK56811.1 unnamed protein product [Paramecium tetraurelia]|eukprot:XP_001424209.1 hypothetical protein (macronuclear) [Paramecium tetraurelia strain d4-2]
MQYINYLKELIGNYFQPKEEVVFIEEKVESIEFDRDVEIIQYRFQKKINKETQTYKRISKFKWVILKRLVLKYKNGRQKNQYNRDFLK